MIHVPPVQQQFSSNDCGLRSSSFVWHIPTHNKKCSILSSNEEEPITWETDCNPKCVRIVIIPQKNGSVWIFEKQWRPWFQCKCKPAVCSVTTFWELACLAFFFSHFTAHFPLVLSYTRLQQYSVFYFLSKTGISIQNIIKCGPEASPLIKLLPILILTLHLHCLLEDIASLWDY